MTFIFGVAINNLPSFLKYAILVALTININFSFKKLVVSKVKKLPPCKRMRKYLILYKS